MSEQLSFSAPNPTNTVTTDFLWARIDYPEPTARATDPDTSHMAAADAKVNAKSLRGRCLTALKNAPNGLTDFELAAAVHSQQTSAGVRRHELVAAGLVCNSGEKRAAPSGSLAIVWRAT